MSTTTITRTYEYDGAGRVARETTVVVEEMGDTRGVARSRDDSQAVQRLERWADELGSHRGGNDADVAAAIRRLLAGGNR